jgi:hypothetical protein
MNIDLHPDTLDDITRQNLKMVLMGFESDLKQDTQRIFVADPKEDKKLIKKHIKAFNLVLDYFGNELS